ADRDGPPGAAAAGPFGADGRDLRLPRRPADQAAGGPEQGPAHRRGRQERLLPTAAGGDRPAADVRGAQASAAASLTGARNQRRLLQGAATRLTSATRTRSSVGPPRTASPERPTRARAGSSSPPR